jgi:hypothetical protein
MRGTVEGFYEPPWSHAAHLAHLEFSAEVGLNTYVYAPKDDPHHRARWREPYPAAELARLSDLAAAARRGDRIGSGRGAGQPDGAGRAVPHPTGVGRRVGGRSGPIRPRGVGPAGAAAGVRPRRRRTAPLVRANSSWPPGAVRDAGLARAVAGALAAEPGALAALNSRLTDLARACRAAARPAWLTEPLRPWLEAGAAMADAGLAAARLLAAASAPVAEVTALRRETRRRLAAAERHYADVLRPVIPPFVRDVLDRTGHGPLVCAAASTSRDPHRPGRRADDR